MGDFRYHCGYNNGKHQCFSVSRIHLFRLLIMKLFLKKSSVFILFLVLYKVIVLSIILFTTSNKYQYNFYGELSNKPKLVLVGSSNLDHNFDYVKLNNHFKNYDVLGCNLNEPSGLYALLAKLQRLDIDSNDLLIFCLPHSLYETDKFFPLKSFKKTGFSKSLILNSITDQPYQFLTSLVTTKIRDVSALLKNYKQNPSDNKEGLSFLEIPTVHLDSKYLDCWVNDQDRFFIRSESYDEDHLIYISALLETKFSAQVLFRFPPLKKDEFNINPKRIDYLREHYNFINDFESSVYKNSFWYNQWYHLNACGRDFNTQNFIQQITPFL
jgi:hypothetical protein